ncbi:bifunctional folylpolyglutamate synthase/dihydrofolate synthase [Leucobacter weissii]|uniref:tetrahydrofolate synthase n=1 Tax=Leucobacter weissii TaxID=1983706 RepID=A0A939ML80_9MICO|nr:folylpolyglutamate synthase/dihydrofolate synthase family protein [Leucobacter weissii]MBO1902626.1 bifunctional folylpolyglutamate synthase/dihydrofolate synthase [Leucobacter weissii]
MTAAERAAERVYEELLKRVGEAHPRPRIEPVRRLAELAGSPQLSYPVMQIAGTNGKTSTARAAESLLRAHGLKTGLFTSPHLVDVTERFQIDGEPVGGNQLADAWDELVVPLEVVDAELAADSQSPITFFEAIAVLAFSLFADAPVDVAVIETGMGGEWDASNIADARVAVLTPIDLDHTAILGPDVESIARTKAGIIKAGSTVVSARQRREALLELAVAAERNGAGLLLADRDFALRDDRLAVGGRQITLSGPSGHDYDPVFLPLHGSHQAENAALAVAAVEAFFGGDRPLPEEVLEAGLGQLRSPGRLQLIASDPVVYVDAAHNPHGADALARAVAESFAFSELALVVGLLGEKDAGGVLEALAPIADTVTLVPVESSRALPVERLAEIAEDRIPDLPVARAETVHEALEVARDWAGRAEGRAVLVTGSVLLAGEAIAHARAEGWGSA